MNTPRHAVSLLLIGSVDTARNAGAPTQATLEHGRRLALRCIEIFGGHTLVADPAHILATFGSANTACRAALVIREKTAALLPADGPAPDIRLACLQSQAYLDGASGQPRADALTPIVAALMASGETGHMRIDAGTHSALSPDLQRQFQTLADSHEASARHHFYRYLPENDDAAAATEIATPLANLIQSARRSERPTSNAAQPFAQTPAPTSAHNASRASGRTQLRITHANARFVLDNSTRVFTIGRDQGCHLNIVAPSISRLHAWIHTDDGRFILRDQSTNGTFVKIGNAPEIHLIHREIILRDTGLIGIAGSTQDSAVPRIEFDEIRAPQGG